MTATRVGVLTLCWNLLLVPTAFAAEHCSWPAEGIALNVRALQTDLMVAALVCGKRTEYGVFMTTYRDRLVAHAAVLRAYFQRGHGTSGEHYMNRFITRLANEASVASNTDRGLYCRSAATMFGVTAGNGMPVFDTLIHEPLLAARHGIPACTLPAISDSGRVSAQSGFPPGGSAAP